MVTRLQIGDPAGGTNGQQFVSFNGDIRIDDGGDIGFSAGLSPGGSSSGTFLASQGSVRTIALANQTLPGSSEIYEGPFGFSMNNRRDFVLVISNNRMVLVADGSVNLVTSSGFPNKPSINDAWEIVFIIRTEMRQPGGPSFLLPIGIVQWRNGTSTRIAASVDLVPGLGGAIFPADLMRPRSTISGESSSRPGSTRTSERWVLSSILRAGI